MDTYGIAQIFSSALDEPLPSCDIDISQCLGILLFVSLVAMKPQTPKWLFTSSKLMSIFGVLCCANATMDPTMHPTQNPTFESTNNPTFILVSSPMNFSQADQYCINIYDTHLASIHSSDENTVSGNLCTTNNCWIGLNDRENEGNLTYTDGSSFDYAPAILDDNFLGKEYCIQIISGGIWNDLSCSSTLPFLCNTPTENPTTDPTADPTQDPTANPTESTFDPTNDPTSEPTIDPTNDPTIDPTIDPTVDPTIDPTIDPTVDPTYDPTPFPTPSPTQSTSEACGYNTFCYDAYLQPVPGVTVSNTIGISSRVSGEVNYHIIQTTIGDETCNLPYIDVTFEETDFDEFREEYFTVLDNDGDQIALCTGAKDGNCGLWRACLLKRDLNVKTIEAGDTYNITIVASAGLDIVCSDYSLNIGLTITCPSESFAPTRSPVSDPTVEPTNNPTVSPTESPTNSPSPAPTKWVLNAVEFEGNCDPTTPYYCFYTPNENDNSKYCCHYLEGTDSNILSQEELYQLVKTVRNLNIASLCSDYFFVILAICTFCIVKRGSSDEDKATQKAGNYSACCAVIGSVIDIGLTFAVVGIIDQNKLGDVLLELDEYGCYSDKAARIMFDLEAQLETIVILDTVEASLDIFCLCLLTVGYFASQNTKSKTMEYVAESIFGFVFAFLDVALITVNVFLFVIPVYNTFEAAYNNDEYLCYSAITFDGILTPSRSPTGAPTIPTYSPTYPTDFPTFSPTDFPTLPTFSPTDMTLIPTPYPTYLTDAPSGSPSNSPTNWVLNAVQYEGGSCDSNDPYYCGYTPTENEYSKYCCNYLSNQQHKLHELITTVRNLNIAAFVFAVGSICGGTFINIFLSFSIVGIVDQNKLYGDGVFTELDDYGCYSDDGRGILNDLEPALQTMFYIHLAQAVADVVGPCCILAMGGAAGDDGGPVAIASFLFLGLVNIILSSVSLFGFMIPSYNTFDSTYNNDEYLCYRSITFDAYSTPTKYPTPSPTNNPTSLTDDAIIYDLNTIYFSLISLNIFYFLIFN